MANAGGHQGNVPAPGSLGDQAIARALQPVPVYLKEFMAGALTGAFGKTIVAPLERLKILYQTGRFRQVPTLRALAEIYRLEGVRGLFKGNTAAVARIAPYSAIHFGAFEVYRRALSGAVGAAQTAWGRAHGVAPSSLAPAQAKSRTRHAAVDLAAGSAAGATAVLATYPLDLVRTRLAFIIEAQGASAAAGVRVNPSTPRAPLLAPASPPTAQASLPAQRKTIRGMLRIILEREGVRGLYHGLGPTMLGILPYTGLKFLIYEGTKREYLALYGAASPGTAHAAARHADAAGGPGSRGERGVDGDAPVSTGVVNRWVSALYARMWAVDGGVPVPMLLLFGAIAGVVSQTVTYPLDVVRRRMQVQNSTAGRLQRYKSPKSNSLQFDLEDGRMRSTWHGLQMIYRRYGVRALFSGLWVNYIKVVPSTAIGFVTYDLVKELLGVPPKHRSSHDP